MTGYDIIHVDDNKSFLMSVADVASFNNLSCLGVTTLNLLEKVLQKESAGLFIVDGKFPRKEGLPVELLYQEAIDLIKSYNQDASVFLCTADNLVKEAHENNAVYVAKTKGAYALIEIIKQQLYGPGQSSDTEPKTI